MYKCQMCNKTTKPREKVKRIVTEYRDKVYQTEIDVYGRKKYVTGYGKEIVKEIVVCEECYKEYAKKDI